MSAATIEAPTIRMGLPGKLAPLLEPHRYKVAHGGRGGAKSWAFARLLVTLGYSRPLRVLCAREVQKSIKDSVHKLLCDQIRRLGLSSHYSIAEHAITGANGTEFTFAGLWRNIDSIKSIEGVDICWVEEAQTVSEDSWAKLIPTVRKDGSEIWVSFNPDLETDPTYQRFVINTPPDAFVVEINSEDNPWLPDTLRIEREYAYRNDPEAAAHIWGGKCKRNSDAQVLRGRWIVEHFDVDPGWTGPLQGSDWGFAQDPSTLMRVYVDEPAATLYVRNEAYGIGVELDHTAALFDSVPEARKYLTRGDSARPETISYLQRNGYPRLIAAVKGPGSLEHGVEFLRSFRKIVIHPDCPHAKEEARLWSFKVDKLTGLVLPDLVDKHNHCWDAVRYALEPLSMTDEPPLARWARTEAERKLKEELDKEEPNEARVADLRQQLAKLQRSAA